MAHHNVLAAARQQRAVDEKPLQVQWREQGGQVGCVPLAWTQAT